MSQEKINRYKEEKKQRRSAGYRDDKELKSLKRDTIGLIIVVIILIAAPIGIMIQQRKQAALYNQQIEEIRKLIEENAASASNATASDAEESTADEAAEDAEESEAASETAAETEAETAEQ